MLPDTSTTDRDRDNQARVSSSLSAAMLLALAGGMLDAFAFLNHGHTFAGAMTGNAVLCGMAVLSHDRAQITQHAAPLLAFTLGVWLSAVLDSRLRHHAVRVGLGAEITGLLLLSLASGAFPEVVFVTVLALLAAYQVTSFRKVDRYSYNSTFITGNLRDAVSAFHSALVPECRAEGLCKARDLGLVILSFLFGAIVGAVLAPRLLNHTLRVVALPLIAVFLLVSFRKPVAPVSTETM